MLTSLFVFRGYGLGFRAIAGSKISKDEETNRETLKVMFGFAGPRVSGSRAVGLFRGRV